ncbi:hypothetical protein [Vibrio salilacus]|uniref:hypothetical protein n=1 Tax=Vibrio salilacus TaxID=1323749 RepID=UPI000C29E856|nr:hypothetical protein [Vibrio salilacus]
MKINFKHLSWAVVIIYLLIMITLHRYPNIPENEVSIADFANILVGLVAIATLIYNILDRHHSITTSQSRIALESYVAKVDSTVEELSKSDLACDRKWFFVLSAHEGLLSTQDYITEEEHKRIAKNKFEELRTHLKLLYFDLKIENFMDVQKDPHKDFHNYRDNLSASVYVFIVCWLKYVVNRTYFFKEHNYTSFGNEWCIDKKYVYSFMSLLVSEPLNILGRRAIIEKVTELSQTLSIPHDNVLLRLAHEYPRVLAYALLSNRLSVYNHIKGVYRPVFQLDCLESRNKHHLFSIGSWFFPLPEQLENPKYLRIKSPSS